MRIFGKRGVCFVGCGKGCECVEVKFECCEVFFVERYFSKEGFGDIDFDCFGGGLLEVEFFYSKVKGELFYESFDVEKV